MASPTISPQIAKELYTALELEAQGDPPGTLVAPGDPRVPAIHAIFDQISDQRKITLGEAIHRYRLAFKQSEDAKVHAEYAERYRGAADDINSEHEWRPTFEYYARRKREYLDDLRRAYLTSTPLYEKLTRWGIDSAAIRNARNTQLDAFGPQLRAIQDDLDQIETKRAAAAARIATFQPVAGDDVAMPDAAADGFIDVGADPVLPVPLPANRTPVWHGTMPLGKGSFGQADLWLGTDRSSIIQKRVVRKQCQLGGLLWTKDQFWNNGAPGNGVQGLTPIVGENTLPMEIHALQQLSNKRGSSSIPKLLNYKLDYWPNKKADVYMEYCPHGDCEDAIKRAYSAYNHGQRIMLRYIDFSQEAGVDLLPEPFLWATFLSLVTAGILMERGSLDKATAPRNWTPFVHRDIKIQNCFMGVPNNGQFPHYPEVKLADFGLAAQIPDPDLRGDSHSVLVGTVDHQPPEMLRDLRAPDGSWVPVSTKTNVWGVGIVLYSLISGTFGVSYDGWFIYDQDGRREPPEFDQSAMSKYSLELRNLVMACMRFDVADRPTFDWLLHEIKRHTGDGAPADERASGLRDADSPAGRVNGDQYLNRAKEDQYLVGWGIWQKRIGWTPTWTDRAKAFSPPKALMVL